MAAEPVLASTLWAASTESASSHVAEVSTKTEHVSTGIRTIDQALRPGLAHGSITCLSCEQTENIAQEIYQASIASHLLSSPHATAAVIDTGSGLDVRRLHQILSRRLGDRHDASDEAAKVLDRVSIMKVFDFVGFGECLSELRSSLEGRSNELSIPTEVVETMKPRGTIGDSEDETDDEMVDKPSDSAVSRTREPPFTTQNSPLLIIDNIAKVATPLLKSQSSYSRGHALLTSFMRSLALLTKTHDICTLLINDVLPSRYTKEDSPSVFSSCMLQPALGKAFTYMLDAHLLCHRMRRSESNEAECYVVEVLQDRHGGRVGRWGALTANEEPDGELRSVT